MGYPFYKKVCNVTMALIRFLKSRGRVLGREIRNERLAVCFECPSYMPTSKRCFICGCFVEVKSWLPQENCPEGKWRVVYYEERNA